MKGQRMETVKDVIQVIVVIVAEIASILVILAAIGAKAINKAMTYFFKINEKDDRTNV